METGMETGVGAKDLDCALIVYITCPSEEKARALGRSMVEKRLAACVNVFERITSYYWWEGSLCEEAEAALIAKTSKAQLDELVRFVKETHDYQVPAVVAIPVHGGNEEFLSWVLDEVRP